MAHYVSSMACFSTGFCNVPGREYICLSMALVGILCLAAAATVVFRTENLASLHLD